MGTAIAILWINSCHVRCFQTCCSTISQSPDTVEARGCIRSLCMTKAARAKPHRSHPQWFAGQDKPYANWERANPAASEAESCCPNAPVPLPDASYPNAHCMPNSLEKAGRLSYRSGSSYLEWLFYQLAPRLPDQCSSEYVSGT